MKEENKSQLSILHSPLIPPGYKQTEVGVIPEDWELEPLCALTDTKRPISYGIVQTGPSVPNGVRCLRVLDLDDGRINKSDLITTTKAISDAYRRTVLKSGDLVMPLRGKIGHVALVEEDLTGSNLTRGLALIAIQPNWSASFCKQFISSIATRSRLEQSMNGSALQEIPIATLRAFKVALPPTKAEQEAIAEALRDADALIESLEQLLTKKRHLKQGAMQELLTGKTRLPGFEIKPGHKQTEVGVIPEDWEFDYIESLAHITTGSRNTQDRVDDGQYPFFVRSQTVERINSYSFDGEAVLTAGDGVGTGKVFHYIKSKFDAHQRVYRISNFNECINGYFFYLYFSSHFYNRIMQMTAKSSVDSVRREMIARMLIPLPPTKAEQEGIAAILSDMDAEIAALEAKLTKTRQVKQGMMQELLTGRIRLV